MKTRCLVVGTVALLVLAGQLLSPAQGQDKEAPKVMKFKFTSLTEAGKKVPKKELAGMVLTVTGNKGVVTKGGKVLFSGTSKMDTDKKPWTIDLKLTGGKDNGKTIKGIMEVKEDGGMRVCFSKPGGKRPTEFSSTAENEQLLEVLEPLKE
jgi:uncharacterized protein (TIGR03067 family)